MSNERESSEDNSDLDPSDVAQRRTLIKVLFINLAQAIVVGVVVVPEISLPASS